MEEIEHKLIRWKIISTILFLAIILYLLLAPIHTVRIPEDELDGDYYIGQQSLWDKLFRSTTLRPPMFKIPKDSMLPQYIRASLIKI